MSVQATYNEWYIRADQAWTAYEDAMDAQSECVDATFEEVARSAELSLEAAEWKAAAEEAEKQMAQMEVCMHIRMPNRLEIPA